MADNGPINKFIAKRAVRNDQMKAAGKPGFSTGKAKLLRQQGASDKKQTSKSTAVNTNMGAILKTPTFQPRIGGHAN